MPPADRKDPYLSFQFKVDLGEKIVAGFSEVTGLDVETEVETFREGGVHRHEQQLTGHTKFPSRLVLKRGMTRDDVLWSWHQDVMKGKVKRRDVSIILQDSAGRDQWTWSFRAATPVKWVGPQFRAAGAEVAIETLELVHRGLVPGKQG
jgi:phage tail-like protein